MKYRDKARLSTKMALAGFVGIAISVIGQTNNLKTRPEIPPIIQRYITLERMIESSHHRFIYTPIPQDRLVLKASYDALSSDPSFIQTKKEYESELGEYMKGFYGWAAGMLISVCTFGIGFVSLPHYISRIYLDD